MAARKRKAPSRPGLYYHPTPPYLKGGTCDHCGAYVLYGKYLGGMQVLEWFDPNNYESLTAAEEMKCVLTGRPTYLIYARRYAHEREAFYMGLPREDRLIVPAHWCTGSRNWKVSPYPETSLWHTVMEGQDAF